MPRPKIEKFLACNSNVSVFIACAHCNSSFPQTNFCLPNEKCDNLLLKDEILRSMTQFAAGKTSQVFSAFQYTIDGAWDIVVDNPVVGENTTEESEDEESGNVNSDESSSQPNAGSASENKESENVNPDRPSPDPNDGSTSENEELENGNPGGPSSESNVDSNSESHAMYRNDEHFDENAGNLSDEYGDENAGDINESDVDESTLDCLGLMQYLNLDSMLKRIIHDENFDPNLFHTDQYKKSDCDDLTLQTWISSNLTIFADAVRRLSPNVTEYKALEDYQKLTDVLQEFPDNHNISAFTNYKFKKPHLFIIFLQNMVAIQSWPNENKLTPDCLEILQLNYLHLDLTPHLVEDICKVFGIVSRVQVEKAKEDFDWQNFHDSHLSTGIVVYTRDNNILSISYKSPGEQVATCVPFTSHQFVPVDVRSSVQLVPGNYMVYILSRI